MKDNLNFKALFDVYPDPVLFVDSSSKILFVNKAFESLVCCSAELMIGRGLTGFWKQYNKTTGNPSLLDSWSGHVRWVLPDAKEESLYVHVYEVSEVGGFALLFRKLEDGIASSSLRSTARDKQLESLGMYTGSVAHDLNNVLTGILGHVSFLRLALSDSPHFDSLIAIEDGAKRAALMTNQILEFAKGEEREFCLVDFSAVVQGALNLLEETFDEKIKLKVSQTNSSDFHVWGDESKLSQVVMNLIINARDSFDSSGGEVEVVIDLHEESSDTGLLKKGPYVKFKVTDNGKGIPENIKSRVFDPFFTTKSSHGTGLGLATVKSIVVAHGGEVQFQSEEGLGTTFAVLFPKAEQENKSTKEESVRRDNPKKIPSGSEKILIVDDEESVRLIMQRGLEHLGYAVDVAEDGQQGVDKFVKNKGVYDLVILDMIMPKMSGEEVFSVLKEKYPELRVLISSGYSSDQRTNSILAGGGLGLIKKPFTIEELAQEVRRCLDKSLK